MNLFRPVKTMFTVKQTFKSFESGSGGIVTNTIGTVQYSTGLHRSTIQDNGAVQYTTLNSKVQT